MQIFKRTERETAGFKIRVLACLTGEKKPGSFTGKSWNLKISKQQQQQNEKKKTRQNKKCHLIPRS